MSSHTCSTLLSKSIFLELKGTESGPYFYSRDLCILFLHKYYNSLDSPQFYLSHSRYFQMLYLFIWPGVPNYGNFYYLAHTKHELIASFVCFCQLLSQGKNLGIAWEYSLPKVETKRTHILKHNYTWTIIRPKCSVSCGTGKVSLKCFKI